MEIETGSAWDHPPEDPLGTAHMRFARDAGIVTDAECCIKQRLIMLKLCRRFDIVKHRYTRAFDLCCFKMRKPLQYRASHDL